MVEKMDPKRFQRFVESSQEAARQRYSLYEQLAGINTASNDDE